VEGLPKDALVVLIGPAGSGKSTFAARHFQPTAVLSSDAFRAIVSDDPDDQDATADAFRLLYAAVRARLRRGRLTVIDATNVVPSARAAALSVARRYGRPAVAIVFDRPLEVCLAWNAARTGRSVPGATVRHHHRLMERAVPGLASEGFVSVKQVSQLEG
jgi:predicted kinase